jgi:hypothetical protein
MCAASLLAYPASHQRAAQYESPPITRRAFCFFDSQYRLSGVHYFMSKQLRWPVAICLALVLIYAIVAYRLSNRTGHTGTLHAGIIVSKTDYGIPGITKTYEARITNLGPFPVLVTHCDFITDASEHGTMVAYAVQRWDASSASWVTVVALDKNEFCKPYPLGISQARLVTVPLWPAKSLSTGDEATAARDAFRKGDIARFVVFTGDPGDVASSVATPSFPIDEERTGSRFPVRIRH